VRIRAAGWFDRIRNGGLVHGTDADPSEWGAAVLERRPVVPTFSEGLCQVSDGWAANLRLHIVPGSAFSISTVQVLGLWVAEMMNVIAAPVAEIDPSDECHVLIGSTRMMRYHQLLVMGSGPSHPLVEQELAPCRVHDAGELRLLFLVESDRAGVRPPEQASNLDASPREVDQQAREGRSVVVEPLVVIAPPVGEVDVVTGAEGTEHLGEPGEVGVAVDQR
jgi:hypothetical protein